MSKKPLILFLALLFAMLVPQGLAANSCLNCHEKLTVFNESEKKLNELRIRHLERGVSCSLECHANTLDKFAKSNYEQWTRSKHALFNVTCNNCHGGDTSSDIKEKAHLGIKNNSDSSSPIYYTNVPETCGRCHAKELNQFMKSKHYQNLKALRQAPTCDTCHAPHEFKVLNESEFHGLCSNCHNIDMKIAPSDAPDKAITALDNAATLRNEIRTAESAIRQGKQDGKDVSAAQKDLDSAVSIRDSLPVLWHEFNLPSFEEVISRGIGFAQKAQEEAGIKPTVVNTTAPKTPGFEAVLSLIGFITLFLFARRLLR